MRMLPRLSLIPAGLLLTLGLGSGAGGTFIALDGAARPLKEAFSGK